MKRNALVVTGFSAVLALGLIGYGCTSGDSVGGTGGTTGGQGGLTGSGQGGAPAGLGGTTGGGQGGAPAGLGGTTGGGQGGAAGGATGGGTGGVTGGGTGGATGGAVALCVAPAPTDKVTACNSDPACTKTCGINASGAGLPRAVKLCTCPGPASVWSCPSTLGACAYPTADWSCLKLPATPVMCPGGGTVVTANTIISGTTLCTPTSGTCSSVCGSPTAGTFSYQDSGGAGKVGYCACIGTKYQCASVAEWAPQ
jgi:hypothetical protein